MQWNRHHQAPERRRRTPSRERRSVLSVTLRGKGGAGGGGHWFAAAAGVALLAALIALSVWGVRGAGRALFSRNPHFTLTNLVIRTGEIINPTLVREYMDVREGTNLYALNIARMRDRFTNEVPSVRNVRIARRLPGTLDIEIVERIPIAYLGRQGHLVADVEGQVFFIRDGAGGLPVIRGFSGPALRPGARIQGQALAALQVADVCDDPLLGIALVAIDADHPDYLVLHLADGRPAKLAWTGMEETPTPESRAALLKQLHHLARVLQSREGRRLSRLDVTFGDRVYGQP